MVRWPGLTLAVALAIGISIGSVTWTRAQDDGAGERGSGATPTVVADAPTAPAGAGPGVAPTAIPPGTSLAEETAGGDQTGGPLAVWQDFLVVLLLLVLVGLGLWRLFDYLNASRIDYYRTVKLLAQQGTAVSPVIVSTFSSETTAAMAVQATQVLEIKGPPTMVSGQPATFTAQLDGVDAPTTAWTVQPADGVTVTPSTGARVEVVATAIGTIILTASVSTPASVTATAAITVVAPPLNPAALDLPFIGQGFGSILGALVLIAAVVALAATDAIDSDVIGVILGALAGYLFGVVANSTTQRG